MDTAASGYQYDLLLKYIPQKAKIKVKMAHIIAASMTVLATFLGLSLFFRIQTVPFSV